MSDLLNNPGRPACGCDLCTEQPSAWAPGQILARIRTTIARSYVDRDTRDRARLYAQLAKETR